MMLQMVTTRLFPTRLAYFYSFSTFREHVIADFHEEKKLYTHTLAQLLPPCDKNINFVDFS